MRLNEDLVLVGEQVVLAPYRAVHVPTYHGWMQSPFLLSTTASEPLSLDEEYAMQRAWHDDADKLTFIVYDRALVRRGAPAAGMVGDVNLFLNDPDDAAAAEVEVMVAEPAARGRGVGREALLQLLRFAAAPPLALRRFVAKIGYDNAPSRRLFNRLGFAEVARVDVFREATLELRAADRDDGPWRDLPPATRATWADVFGDDDDDGSSRVS